MRVLRFKYFISLRKITAGMIVIILTVLILMLGGCAAKKLDLSSFGISEPLKESRIINLSVESKSMERRMPCQIYLPKGYGSGEAYPVWYGLNSYSTDESMWIDSGIAKAADELIDRVALVPMIMVFPYTKDATIKEITKDLEDGKIDERNIDKFLSRELVDYVDESFYTKKSSKDRYIGGFSMGGMISLRVAFHHPDIYSKVGGYSAAVLSQDYSDRQLEEWLFPNDSVKELKDIKSFDQKKGLDRLTVYLDAGITNDPFMTGLQSLNDALQQRGIHSEFELFNGGHTLRTDSLKDYLMFYFSKE